ncbi:MAG: caspase family protein, partial [Bacteroidota bacterium]
MNITRDVEFRTRLTLLSSEKGKYYFLGIGIDKYEHHKTLNNAVEDIKAVKNLLIEKYQFESSPLIFLKDKAATRTEILHALSIISKPLTEQDNLLIYYAGHGMLDEHNDGYLIPVEEKRESRGLAIEFDTIKKFITNSRARNVLFIADCCYA